MLDLVLKAGHVFDGLGSPPKVREIGIRDGRIVRIAKNMTESAGHTLDMAGKWVVPGFVDIHTHYDIELEVAPGLSESVRHGVTSVVIGNCSLSLTMGDPATLADIFLRVETLPEVLVRKWLDRSTGWESPAAYFQHLRTLPLGPNVAAMLGHSALRAKVMGLERSLHERATGDDLHAMRRLAEEALDAGCIGISVDMVHWHRMSGTFAGRSLPSHHAAYREFATLADVCRQRDAVFQVTPNPENWRSFVNILRLSPGLFRPPLRNTILSALDMYEYPNLWRIFPIILFVFNRLLGSNIRFQTLTEPFTIYSDGPITPLFEEFEAGVRLNSCRTTQERKALWQDKEFRAQFGRQWARGWPRSFHRNLAAMKIVRAPAAGLAGRTFADVAAERGVEPVACFVDLLARYDDQIRWVSTGANDRPAIRQRLMKHPHILPGFTDAGAHCRNIAYFDGALALLRQAVQTGFMTPQAAVRRVTGEAAGWFGLDTGVLREGARADITVLRPTALKAGDAAAAEIEDPVLDGAVRMVKRDPNQTVGHVFIAGREVVRDGVPLPVLGQEGLGEVSIPQAACRGRDAVLARHRNRINNELTDHPFDDYWEVFVLKHQHPGNIALHCLGFVMMYAVAAGAVIAAEPLILLLMPVSQLTGVAGHALFERSHIDTRDALFSWRALFCLHRMFGLVVSGRYGKQVASMRRRLAEVGDRHPAKAA